MTDQTTATESQDPHDMNGAHFQHQSYLEKLLKEKSLPELMDKETEIVKRECCSSFIYMLCNKFSLLFPVQKSSQFSVMSVECLINNFTHFLF